MDTQGWARLAPLSGVVAVALWIVGIVIIEASDSPATKAPASEILAWMNDNTTAIIVAGWLFLLGSGAAIWFLGSLRAALARAEGPEARLSSVGFAAGVGATLCWSFLIVPTISAAMAIEYDNRVLSEAAAETLYVVGNGFFLAGELMLAAAAAATAIVVLRHAALPRWYGWVTALYALALAVIFVGWLAFIFATPVWILLTAGLLWRGQSAPAAGEAGTATA